MVDNEQFRDAEGNLDYKAWRAAEDREFNLRYAKGFRAYAEIIESNPDLPIIFHGGGDGYVCVHVKGPDDCYLSETTLGAWTDAQKQEYVAEFERLAKMIGATKRKLEQRSCNSYGDDAKVKAINDLGTSDKNGSSLLSLSVSIPASLLCVQETEEKAKWVLPE